ncbi:NAD(P)H-dependent oxidoreductase [Brevibacillus humidisoli]|uniref:NAD(P)H-dependent oxidoreductase n=1 Tax=Brevibacillus humidisoli TaxID=2895522 RepID=UPI001E476ECB|nr:NAD(P)H-dependent oxidoreductase [Brevibacillus humidisoli]UFJ43097.1 NAD(P)H-dependent oxidoreductase [Brevibacillus humidisoli]
MKALIVFAHPGDDSFNHGILRRVTAACERQAMDWRLRNLYQINFQPVYSSEDMRRIEAKQVSPDVEEEQILVTESDLLVMIFPVWWWAPPAILKGWIDRVFTNGFAFHYKEKGPVGLLRGKQAVLFTTTRESVQEMKTAGYDQLITRQIAQGVLSFAGFDPVIHKNFAAVPYVTAAERSRMLQEVDDTMSSLRLPLTV